MWGWLRPKLLRRRVTISLTDDPNVALEGVLWQATWGWFVLKDAAMLTKDTGPDTVGEKHMPGDVWVPRGNVLFLQVNS